MIGVFGREVDEAFSIQAHLAEMRVIRVLAGDPADGLEIELFRFGVEVRDLFHDPFAGSDRAERLT